MTLSPTSSLRVEAELFLWYCSFVSSGKVLNALMNQCHASERLETREVYLAIVARLSWVEQVHHFMVGTCVSLPQQRDRRTKCTRYKCLSQSWPYFLMLFDNMLIKVLLNFSTRPSLWGWYLDVFIFLVPINLHTSWMSNERKFFPWLNRSGSSIRW